MNCGTDIQLLNAAIKAQIPNIEMPISVKWNDEDISISIALLDFVEFCYSKIVDINEDDYHSFFKHFDHFISKHRKRKGKVSG